MKRSEALEEIRKILAMNGKYNGAAHMNFDAKGNLVGSSMDCAKSHRKKK